MENKLNVLASAKLILRDVRDILYGSRTSPIRAFCQTRNNITYVLSLAPNDVKKNLSVAVHIKIALGITSAVFSLVIDVTSFQRRHTKVSQLKIFA